MKANYGAVHRRQISGARRFSQLIQNAISRLDNVLHYKNLRERKPVKYRKRLLRCLQNHFWWKNTDNSEKLGFVFALTESLLY